MGANNQMSSQPGFSTNDLSYIRNETWFEVNRYEHDRAVGLGIEHSDPRSYILVINSYGRLHKLFTDTGGFEDVTVEAPNARP